MIAKTGTLCYFKREYNMEVPYMLDIFDILGPVMVGPSSSHTAGAVRIGRMARVLLGEEPIKTEIGLYGSFAETGQGHGTNRALIAGLLGLQPDDMDVPNSFALAANQGLDFSFYTARLREAHPNTAVLDVTGVTGKKLTLQAASIGGGRIRVEQLNGVEVNFTGNFNTLIIRHWDVAGEVANVTRELAAAQVNIANMSVCRSKRGGEALMVIETDHKIPVEVRSSIADLKNIRRVTYYEKEE